MAIDPENQEILGASASVGLQGNYRELNVRFSPIRSKEREVEKLESTIIPLFEVNEGGKAGQDVAMMGNAGEEDAMRLDELSQQAFIDLEANNRKDARMKIDQIREIDPNYQYLPELEQQLEEL